MIDATKEATLRAVREWCDKPSIALRGAWDELRRILGLDPIGDSDDADKPAVRALLALCQPSESAACSIASLEAEVAVMRAKLAWYERLERVMTCLSKGDTRDLADEFGVPFRGYEDGDLLATRRKIAAAALRDKPTVTVDPQSSPKPDSERVRLVRLAEELAEKMGSDSRTDVWFYRSGESMVQWDRGAGSDLHRATERCSCVSMSIAALEAKLAELSTPTTPWLDMPDGPGRWLYQEPGMDKPESIEVWQMGPLLVCEDDAGRLMNAQGMEETKWQRCEPTIGQTCGERLTKFADDLESEVKG